MPKTFTLQRPINSYRSNQQIIILGGVDSKKSAIILDLTTNTYNTGVPSMNNERNILACALIKRSPMHENRPVVLAVGGYDLQPTAEVYDYTQPKAEWQESKQQCFFFVLF